MAKKGITAQWRPNMTQRTQNQSGNACVQVDKRADTVLNHHCHRFDNQETQRRGNQESKEGVKNA